MEGGGMEMHLPSGGITIGMKATEPEDELGYNPQIDCGYDPQLRDDRRETKDKLRRRFEHIYEKYGRDFEGIADEIDLATGEIVVDNGHLHHMQHEADVGVTQPSEKQVGEDTHDVGRSDIEVDYDADSDDEGSSFADAGNTTFSSRDSTVESNTSLFELDESAQEDGSNQGEICMRAPVAAKQHRPRHEGSISGTSSKSGASSDHDNAGAAIADNLLDRVPGLKESMLSLQAQYKSGRSMDQDAIHALGMSIANQLASFVSSGGRQKSKTLARKSTEKPRSHLKPPSEPPAKRQRRTPSPLPSTTGLSPGERSIWAPMRYPRQQTRKRKRDWKRSLGSERLQLSRVTQREAHSDLEDAPNIPSSSEQVQDDQARSCTHCASGDSHIWRKGPHGLLCNTCGMYFYRYGLLRPLGLLGQEEVRDAEESDGEMDPLLRDWLDYEESDKKTAKRPVGVQNARFTPEEDASLIRFKEIEAFSWERMAMYFPGRSAYALQCRYSKKLQHQAQAARSLLLSQGYKGDINQDGITVFSYTHEPFTDAEDELILRLRDESELGWEEIALSFDGRSAVALEQRYLDIENDLLGSEQSEFDMTDRPRSRESFESLRHARYTYEEDATIVKLREVDKLSFENMAELLPGRHATSLQKRYIRELCGRHPESVLPSRKAYDHDVDNLRYGGRQSAPPDARRVEASWNGAHDIPHPVVDTHSARQLDNGDMQSMHEIFAREAISEDTVLKPARSPIIESILAKSEMPFNESDDRLILKLRERENLPWPSIAEHLPGRTVPSISDRYYHHLLPKKARALEAFVQGSTMPTASDLFPDVWTIHQGDGSASNKRWTTRETDIMVMLREQGRSWKEIADRLPGRTSRASECHYAMIFGRTRKRKSFPTITRPNAEKPLLKQAVKNSRRLSVSGATTEKGNGTKAASACGEVVAPTRPKYKLLLPSPFPRDLVQNENVPPTKPRASEPSSATAQIQLDIQSALLPAEVSARAGYHDKEPEAPDSSHFLLNESSEMKDQMAEDITTPAADDSGNEIMARAHPEVFRDTDDPNGSYLETPARLQRFASVSIEPTPRVTSNYDTPAKFNPQGHPYFLRQMVSRGSLVEEEPVPYLEGVQQYIEDGPDLKEGLKLAKKKLKSETTAVAPACKGFRKSKRTSTRRKVTPLEETTDDDDGGWAAPDIFDEDEVIDDVRTTDEDLESQSVDDQNIVDMQIRREETAAAWNGGGGAGPNTPTTRDSCKMGPSKQLDQTDATEPVLEVQAEPFEIDINQPPYTYAQLVSMALQSKAPMTTREIYTWLEGEFPWCQRNTAWKSSVRGALSRNPQFGKLDQNSRKHNVRWVLSDVSTGVDGKAMASGQRAYAGENVEEMPVPSKSRQKQARSSRDAEKGLVKGRTDSKSASSHTPSEEPSLKSLRRPRGRAGKGMDVAREDAMVPTCSKTREASKMNAGDGAAVNTNSTLGRCNVASSKKSSKTKQHSAKDPSATTTVDELPVVATKQPLSRDFIRDSESESSVLDTNDPVSAGSSALQHALFEANSDSGVASSSPILTKQAAPSITYKKTSTPRSDTHSSLFRNMHKRGSNRTSTPAKVQANVTSSRASSVSAHAGIRRVVHTPVREVGDSEDELA